MKRALLIGLLGLCLLPAGADAVTITGENLSRPYQAWADTAKVPTPAGHVAIDETGTCAYPGWDRTPPGCTFLFARIITVDPDRVDREIFLYELGHIFDYWTLPDWARNRFLVLTSDPRDWSHGQGQLPPSENFSGAYADCALGRPFQTQYRPVGPNGQRAICRMIRRIGGWISTVSFTVIPVR